MSDIMTCDVPPECELNNEMAVWGDNDHCPVCNKLFLKDDRIRCYMTMVVHEKCAWCIVCGTRDCSQSGDMQQTYRIFPGRGLMHDECTRCGICGKKSGEGIIERFPQLFVLHDECGLFRCGNDLYHASCIGCQCISCEMEKGRANYRPSGNWAKWGQLPVDEFAEVAHHFERRYDKVVLDPTCRTCTRCCIPVVCMAAPRYTVDDYPVAHEVCKRCNKCMCKYKDNRDHVKCLPKLNMKDLSISTKKPRRAHRPSVQWKKQLEQFV